ncbi:regulatory LuxR family protein [Jatrophihabitans sp. GAS493]|uniref:helix-turn-helix transcriptional regulator n=1 Tax=Jatrophihabitans sp. GAS493 TaxID=1907575 RepID=UPI000BB8110F|nr:AAA family ATPase [Jatrophihabitans sp. GAS493]SOD74954.1 regulatory LuxR family protein [Jatrophihabitans sp. GAS493]
MSTHELIGRDAELDVLRRLIANVKAEGAAVLVRGQPGVGKSSILRVAAEIARENEALVLSASGVESEAMLPFAGLGQLLRPLMTAAATLPAAQRRALMAALGERGGPPPELFLTALAALTLIVDAAASEPLVVVVDDLQWLDGPTNDVLAFISRRLSDDPVIMICGVRDGHPVAMASAGSLEIDLHGLDTASSQQLLARVADGLTIADQRALLDQARGNPLALVELPAVWRSAGVDILSSASATVPLTTRLQQAFASRITDLPSITRDVLLIAAVNAEENLAEVLAGASLLCGHGVLMESVEPAAAARLVEFDQVTLRFRHPLVRSAVLHVEPLPRRQAAHAAMSGVLVAEEYRRVWHRAQSVEAPDDAVADLLDASHLECIGRGSVLSAIAALERSAELTSTSGTRARRLLLAAQHAFGLGRADLVTRLVEAAELNDLSELDRVRAEWLRELFSEGTLGDSARVRELCTLATRSAAMGESDLAFDLVASAALRCWWAVGDAGDREHVAGVASTLSTRDDARRTYAVAVADPLGHVRTTLARLEATTVFGLSDVHQMRQLGMAARAIGAEAQAADYFGGVESKLRERGQLGLLSHLLAVQAAVYLDLGSWRRAGESLAEGRQLSQETGQSTWRTGTAIVGAVFESLTGNIDVALGLADEIEAACAGQAAGDFLSLVQLSRGIAHLSSGRHADAYRALVPMFDPAQRCYHPREQLSAVMFLVEAAVGCGEEDEARDLVECLERLVVTTPSPILDVHLLYARPLLADNAHAEQLFLDGLRQDLTRWPWPRARIELAYGTWLRRNRRLVESRVPLRSAVATFDAIGAVEWGRQAREGLRAAGERTQAVAVETSAARLTAQEMQIARLAADGLSNREIGEQLYLSPRTIGSHLYRIFPKLGITSRAQLADRIAE